MAKILVKSPVTSNGRDPIMSAEGKIVYKETILYEAAKPVLEKINAKLPTHLKKVITDIPAETVTVRVDPAMKEPAAIVENPEAPPKKPTKPETKP